MVYSSVTDLRAEADQPYRIQRNADLANGYLTSTRSNWLGIEGGAPAVLAALTAGYPEGERAIRSFHDQIKAELPRAVGHHRSRVKGAFGDELDVHTMYRGAFDKAWTSTHRLIKKGTGILRLVIDIAGNANVSADQLRWRGIAGLSLAEVMSKAGYSVEIVAAFAIQGYFENKGYEKMYFACTIKARGTQPDYGLLAATVALPGFFRTLGFCSITRSSDNQNKRVDLGLGNYLDVSGVLPVPDKVTQLMVPNTCIDHASSVHWVKQTVNLLQGSTS
jgi:hypothetical protein